MKNHENIKRIPLQVQFRHMPKSEAIFSLVRQETAGLQKLVAPDSHCEVVIDETQRRHFGGVYEVRIRLTVPGDRVYAAHGSEQSGSHEFLYGAVRDAFNELRQQLKKNRKKKARRQRLLEAA
jgi:ribosome-associated translation inhibitor RaiA